MVLHYHEFSESTTSPNTGQVLRHGMNGLALAGEMILG